MAAAAIAPIIAPVVAKSVEKGVSSMTQIITKPIIGYKRHTTRTKKNKTTETDSSIQLSGLEVLGAGALVAFLFAVGAIRWKAFNVKDKSGKAITLIHLPAANPQFAGVNIDNGKFNWNKFPILSPATSTGFDLLRDFFKLKIP